MARKWKIILSVICIASVIGISLMRAKNNIPLLDGLYWDMSPAQASRVLGSGQLIDENSCDTGKNIYQYHTTAFGQDATVTCSFLNDRKLTDFEFVWEDCAADLSDRVYNCLYDHYGSKEDFFFDKDLAAQTIRIGTNNGVTGVFYTIAKDGTTLRVSCVHNA